MDSPASQAIQLGVPLDERSSIYFFLCLGAAIFIVLLYAMKKFEESTLDANEDKFMAQLLPKYLATREEYSKALVWYIGTLILTVVIFSLLGPRAVSLGSAETAALGNVLPLFIALVLVGVLPAVPVLQGIEPRLRRFFHERAFIPAAARATAEKMAAADFDFGLYSDPDLLAAPEMQGVERRDFERPRGTLEYTWARLSCLSYELQRCRDAGKIENLDDELLQRYGKDLDEIVEKRKSFERDVAQYRRDKRRNPRINNDQLHRAMRDVLRQLYVLLGCAVRLKLSPQADINSVLRQFGFVLEPAAPHDENHDVILVGLTVMTGSVFALAFTAVVANWLLGHLGLWQGSAAVPERALRALHLGRVGALRSRRGDLDGRIHPIPSHSSGPLVRHGGSESTHQQVESYSGRRRLRDRGICHVRSPWDDVARHHSRNAEGSGGLHDPSGGNRRILRLSSG